MWKIITTWENIEKHFPSSYQDASFYQLLHDLVFTVSQKHLVGRYFFRFAERNNYLRIIAPNICFLNNNIHE